MSKKTVIFDFDGVITNTHPFVIDILNSVHDELGFSMVTDDSVAVWHHARL